MLQNSKKKYSCVRIDNFFVRMNTSIKLFFTRSKNLIWKNHNKQKLLPLQYRPWERVKPLIESMARFIEEAVKNVFQNKTAHVLLKKMFCTKIFVLYGLK
jgi:hypothetical protein